MTKKFARRLHRLAVNAPCFESESVAQHINLPKFMQMTFIICLMIIKYRHYEQKMTRRPCQKFAKISRYGACLGVNSTWLQFIKISPINSAIDCGAGRLSLFGCYFITSPTSTLTHLVNIKYAAASRCSLFTLSKFLTMIFSLPIDISSLFLLFLRIHFCPSENIYDLRSCRLFMKKCNSNGDRNKSEREI